MSIGRGDDSFFLYYVKLCTFYRAFWLSMNQMLFIPLRLHSGKALRTLSALSRFPHKACKLLIVSELFFRTHIKFIMTDSFSNHACR